MVALTKPLLRGVSHQVACVAALLAGVWLVSRAAPRYQLGAAIYAATLALQLGLSALYHRPAWRPEARRWARRLDHAGIFLLIAGTGTPLALTLEPGPRVTLLWILWVGAAAGVLRALFWVDAPKWLVAVLAIAVGWGTVPYLPAFSRSLDATTVVLVVTGGVVYSIGGAVYAMRRPDPWPRVFGYHELFHAFTIVAAICHFVAIERSVLI